VADKENEVPRPELGTKRLCPTTGRKFYDLGRSPVVSPYSGEVVPIAASVAPGRYAAPVVARREVPVEEEDEQDGPELVSLDEAEEGDKGTDTDAEGDDALVIDDDSDDSAADDARFVVDDEDDDSAPDLVEVDEDEDEES
jgi:uncharacterized protein (TIGR02300 family)